MRLLTSIALALWSICLLDAADAYAADAYTVNTSHPRILLNSDSVKELAKHSQGSLREEYAELKSNADRAVETGQQGTPFGAAQKRYHGISQPAGRQKGPSIFVFLAA